MYCAVYYIKDNLPKIIAKFEKLIGLKKFFVIVVNNLEHKINIHKYQHSNLGPGKVGFKAILRIVHNQEMVNTIKIIQTPYVDNNPPCKAENECLKWRKSE